jgi:hypothetical protein
MLSRVSRRRCARLSCEVNHLEGDLLALEATATTAATAETTAATATVTESTTSTATAATATTEATAATTVTEATSTATAEATATAAVVVTGLGIVKADLATLNGLAVQLLKSLLGIINGSKGNVSETLRATRLTEKWLARCMDGEHMKLRLTGR